MSMDNKFLIIDQQNSFGKDVDIDENLRVQSTYQDIERLEKIVNMIRDKLGKIFISIN